MNRKIINSCYISFALVFFFGLFMIHTTTGKLGLVGFIGYNLAALAIFAELCTIITSIVLKMENKKNEK